MVTDLLILWAVENFETLQLGYCRMGLGFLFETDFSLSILILGDVENNFQILNGPVDFFRNVLVYLGKGFCLSYHSVFDVIRIG